MCLPPVFGYQWSTRQSAKIWLSDAVKNCWSCCWTLNLNWCYSQPSFPHCDKIISKMLDSIADDFHLFDMGCCWRWANCGPLSFPNQNCCQQEAKQSYPPATTAHGSGSSWRVVQRWGYYGCLQEVFGERTMIIHDSWNETLANSWTSGLKPVVTAWQSNVSKTMSQLTAIPKMMLQNPVYETFGTHRLLQLYYLLLMIKTQNRKSNQFPNYSQLNLNVIYPGVNLSIDCSVGCQYAP